MGETAIVTTDESANDQMKFVGFVLGEEEYAVPIEMVKEIIRLSDITPLPNAPASIVGVINLRGEIIPILNLSHKFGFDKCPDHEHKIMIVEYGDTQVGLEVSDVKEVLVIESSNISAAPPMTTSVNSEYIAGVGKYDDRLLIILNLQKLLATEDEFLVHESGKG